jgi:predicted kinase
MLYHKEILNFCCINPISYKVDWEELCIKFPVFEKMKTIYSHPKWHAEGSVFDHTKMAYEWLIENKDIYLPHIILPAVLFHDIGKTECPIGEDGYVLSNGHELLSVKLCKVLLKDTSIFLLSQILCLIEHHDLRIKYRSMKYENIMKTVKYIDERLIDNYFIDLLVPMFEADFHGSIRTEGKEMEKIEDDLIKLNLYFTKPQINVLFGVPGSGKNYFIENVIGNTLDFPHINTIISRDDIREELFGDKNNMNYENEVNKLFEERLITAFKNRENIIINNTNLKRKYRKRFQELAEQYFYDYQVVVIERDLKEVYKSREGEKWKEIITNMLENTDYPSLKGEPYFVVDGDYFKKFKNK